MTTLLKPLPNLSVRIFAGKGLAHGVGRAVSQFAQIVQPPLPDGAVGGQRRGMAVAAGNGDDVAHIQNLNGVGPVEGGSIAHFTVGIVSPGPDRSIGPQCQDMKPAGGNGGDIGQAGHLRRIIAGAGRAVAQFASLPLPQVQTVPFVASAAPN